MNILMISAEMAPFAKVGGLGDVVDALSHTLAARGHDVRVVLPLYSDLDRKKEKISPIKGISTLSVRIDQAVHPVRIYRRGSARAGVKVYLVESAALFDRDGIYTDSAGDGFDDALERAALHAQVALQLPGLLDWPVDVIHCHDAAAVPGLLYRSQWYRDQELPGQARTVLTIHNLAHQEIHDRAAHLILGLPASLASYPGLLEFHGQVNLLKSGILNADVVNTVSPHYATETRTSREFGCDLEGVLDARGEDYCGILNGADYNVWNPAKDSALAKKYSPANLQGKSVCRQALLAELGLSAAKITKPLAGFVGRLVRQKGVDLMLPIMERLAADGFGFAILGTGEKWLEQAVAAVAKRFPEQIAFIGHYDDGLAHRIYAGSDLFLMPSAFEPCGLSQMYALKYGTPPVVRKTGGLADTVDEQTGFVFEEARPEALLAALRSAEKAWADPKGWLALQKRGMARDFSWDEAAIGYEGLYKRALAKGRS